MMKNIKLFLLLCLIAQSTAVLADFEPYTVSCVAERALIDRYKQDQESAINEYNELINRCNHGTASKFEKKCILESQVPEKVASYPYGFQWLARFFIKKNEILPIKISPIVVPSNDLQVLAQDHLHAIIGKASDRAVFLDKNHIPEKIIQTMIINKNYLHRADRSKQLTEQQIELELYNGANKILPKDMTRQEMLQALSYHRTMEFVQQIPKKYTHCDSSKKQRQKFCERYWPMIQSETREQQITRLKKENPVDTTAATNRFIGLFDRIA